MRKILISDDHALNLTVLGYVARLKGMRVVLDSDSAVVALAAVEHPDLILLDLSQRVNGRELLHRLKAEPATCDVPVWVMSGHDDPALENACLDLGAERFLVKPFDAMVELDCLCRTDRD